MALYLFTTYALPPLIDWVVTILGTILSILSALVAAVVAAIAGLLEILGKLAVIIGACALGVFVLALLHKLLHTLFVKPAESFNKIYAAVQERQKAEHPKQVVRLADRHVWRLTLNEGRNAVQMQQRRIRLLTICLIISISVCYLHQRSPEERAQLEETLPQMSETGAISFIAVAIFFYILKSFAGLKGVLTSLTNLFGGFLFSTLFGITTVIAVVLVSNFIEQVPLSVPQIALLLFSNAIVWLFESSIQVVADLIWIPGNSLGDTIQRFWRKLKSTDLKK